MLHLFRARRPAPAPPSAFREWRNAVLFAVVAATLLRWSSVDAYNIPTPSMEGSLLVGDHLFVNRLLYGPLTPRTPLQVPLTHQTIPGLGWKSYSDLIQLPTYRLPGFSSIQRNDVVVFHVPHEQQYPADLRTHLIKRCVAVAGDTVALRHGQVFVNGQAAAPAGRMQTTYFLAVTDPGDAVRRDLTAHGVVDYNQPDGVPVAVRPTYGGPVGFVVSCPPDVAAYFRQQPYTRSLTEIGGDDNAGFALFPDAADFHSSAAASAVPRHWTLDNYGPLPVPKQGQTIALTPANAAIYYKIIAQYEGNDGITWRNGMIEQHGRPLTRYTLKQNYYFMLGDNRHNSEDSRFWGFVPEDHVVGKAVFVWWSVDPHADLLHRIRWSRLFRPIS